MIMDRSWSLIRDILRGKWRLLDPLLELLLLPLSLHVVLLTIVASSMQSYLVFYGVCSILLVVAHVMAAIMSTGGGIRELKALLLVPRYIIWKVLISHNILKSSDKTANWDRTPRE